MKVLIIPDVHARRFWKYACNEHIDKVDHIVFLGDYFDPYYMEYDPYRDTIVNGKHVLGDNIIADDNMLTNFIEIIKLKEANPDKVHLLLGNHDMHYISRKFYNYCGGTRWSYKYHTAIEALFADDIDKFQYAYSLDCNEYTLLCIHGGINLGWYNLYGGGIEHHKQDIFTKDTKPNEIADIINNLKEDDPKFSCLCDIAWVRGGNDKYGGPFWCNADELFDGKEHEYKTWAPFGDKLFQITGHTQLKEDPIVLNNSICCDVRRAFIFDTDSKKLFELDGTECLTLNELKKNSKKY
jgi:predicted phosphodiesterase